MDALETTLLLLIGAVLGYLVSYYQRQLLRFWRRMNYRPRLLRRVNAASFQTRQSTSSSAESRQD